MKRAIFTVGHSTRTRDEFIQLLWAYEIETVVDVRKIAKSRHNPQFTEENLRESLSAASIAYQRLEGLGGHRPTTSASVNQGWRNLSFRGYADYMQTPEFAASLEHLLEIGKERRTSIMCAEAVPWRCHRSLIADALVIRDVSVIDILSATSSRPHALTPFAQVVGKTLTYPKQEERVA